MVLLDKVEVPDDLRITLKTLHKFGHAPEDQSIRNGTQINLSSCNNKLVRSFLRSFGNSIKDLVKTPCVYAGVWSIRMSSGGYHVPHTHPKGWMSGVVYIEIPDNTSGLLQIGTQLERTIIPEVGKVVLFPSWLPHGTTEYKFPKPRLTIAFDLHEIHTRPQDVKADSC